jgi:hypothetical protein
MSKKEQGLKPGTLLLLRVDDEVDGTCLSASSVGDDHAVLKQDLIRKILEFEDPITEDYKKI